MQKEGGPLEALEILDSMPSKGIEPNLLCYTAAISAFSLQSMWKESLQILKRMIDAGIRPDEVVLNTILKGLATAGRWIEAYKLLLDMNARGFGLNTNSYNWAVAACKKRESKRNGISTNGRHAYSKYCPKRCYLYKRDCILWRGMARST